VTTKGAQILDEFKRLSVHEKREVCAAILRETASSTPETTARRKTVADVAGKYRPLPSNHLKDHDRFFAEAILDSKIGSGQP
jgi:hypothetical protein